MFGMVPAMALNDHASSDFTHSIGVPNGTVRISPVEESDADVIERYEPGVRRYCRSRTRSPEDAEDAVQDTFMRYLRRSERKIRNKEAWLITAAWRACQDINRRRRRDDDHTSTASPWDACFDTDESEDIVDVRADDPEASAVEHLTVTALFRRMNPREARVLASTHFLGATSTQLANYLHVTPENLLVIASRARRHARAILADMERTAGK